MSAVTMENWRAANQRYLVAAVAVVRAAVERCAGREEAVDEQAVREALRAAADDLPALSALEHLCTVFGLSPFERDVLLMCAGIELESDFASICAAVQGDPAHTYPTFSLALAALPEAHWSALTPAAPLRRWRLVEVGSGSRLASNPLRIDERILHYLTGLSHLDERLEGLVQLLPPPAELPPSYSVLARRVEQIWSREDGWEQPLVELCGAEHAGKLAVAAASCASLGTPLYVIRAADIPAAAAEREPVLRLWEREVVLTGSALLVDADDLDGADNPGLMVSLLSFLERVHGRVLATSRDPLRTRQRPSIRLDVDKPHAREQRALWQRALGTAAGGSDGELDEVIAQFRLGFDGIQAAATAVLGGPSGEEGQPPVAGSLLWEACRAQARPRLDDLAQRIEAVAAWDDLVLPEPQMRALRDIAAHLRQRTKVYQAWGFAAKSSRGLGISALFDGASGTGKTMAAEVLAGELHLDLYRIDLSQVVSKYIGETEKNLRRVFDAAEEGGAILLFDEADALFGKRSEVKDSHDRYANIEVSYLLQRMESYRGVAILTTNMKGALDSAFLRRIRFIVQFPFPDAGQRAEIWRRIFPADTPRADLDIQKLARLNVAGGTIRNIALKAAFLAADADEPVRMVHLLHAARDEYAKREKPLPDAEVGGWM